MQANKYSGFWVPGLLVILTGTYAYWASQRELVSSRPSIATRQGISDPLPTPGVRTVHSRMWEDPLSSSNEHWQQFRQQPPPLMIPEEESGGEENAVQMERPKDNVEPKGGAENEGFQRPSLATNAKMKREMKKFFRDLVRVKPTVCLPVFLPGGPYADDKEKRMRTRYAVVTALAESGYHLSYNDRMSYVVTEIFVKTFFAWHPREIVVPVKLYKHDEINRPQVLVLWINEAEVGERPLLTTHRILNEFFSDVDEPNNLDVSIIGPSSSGTLKKMADEANQMAELDDPALGPPVLEDWKYISYFPSPKPPQLIEGFQPLLPGMGKEGVKNETVSIFSPRATMHGIEFNANRFFKLYRVIGTDRQLVNALHHELDARGVLPGKIVLITEHDTAYGREIQSTFEQSFNEENVRTFKVLRGIDGILPGDPKESAKTTGGRGNSTDQPEVVERQPEGRSQYDYLTRLHAQICEQFPPGSPHRLAAIGVVGSDVYDKLLILRALKPQFPDCLFFTTDLDAIYAHSDERQHTRNLIVASHFGLSLGSKLQQQTAPFRDSYQTATFLATRLAIFADKLGREVNSENDPTADLESAAEARQVAAPDHPTDRAAWLEVWKRYHESSEHSIAPVIHVVGRSQLHQLTDFKSSIDEHESVEANVHLGASPGMAGWHISFVAVVTVGGIFGVLLLMLRERFRTSLLFNRGWDELGQAWVDKLGGWRRRLNIGFLSLLGIGLLLMAGLVVNASTGIVVAAPFDGYNTWTRNILYAATGMMAVLLIAYLLDRFIVMLNEVRSDKGGKTCEKAWEIFRMTHVTKAAVVAVAFVQIGVLFVCGFKSWCTLGSSVAGFGLLAAAAWHYRKPRGAESTVILRDDLRKNLILSSRPQRVIWMGIVSTFVLTCVVAMLGWLKQGPPPGWHPASTSRYWIARAGDGLTEAYALGMVGMLLAALLSCYLWCIEFSSHAKQQISSAFPHGQGSELQMESEHDRLWLIGKLTSVIGSLVPALLGLLLVLVIAHHPLVSPAPMPMGLLIIISTALGLFLGPALLVRWHFNSERERVLDELHYQILAETGSDARRGKTSGEPGASEPGQPDDHGGDSELVVVMTSDELSAGESEVSQRHDSLELRTNRPLPSTAVQAGQNAKQHLEDCKQHIEALSEGVFKPWAQSPLGWVLGGGASLALVDLWVRWWTYGL